MKKEEKGLLRNNRGFTLIELIMVIVILGILAAVAIPKYISMKSDAEKATGHGITASLQGSIAMLHAQYLVHGTDYAEASVVANVQAANITLAGASGTITAAIPGGKVFTWAYVDNVTDVAAYVTESGGW